MDFGLGLVLSFTDRATAGINNAVNSLSQLTQVAESASSSLNQMASLSALSVVSGQIGNSFLKAGSSILGVFKDVLTQTQSIGMEFENFDVTLTSLFGGAEQGAKKSQEALSKLFDFAKKSPLEVGDVKDMIVTLQSQGINAFDQATGAISGTRQEFLAFLTDLKSFKPEVSNERFKMAIQNYIGSGEKKMMRTVFDMGDIEDIIGHSVSDTAEGRMNDIIEMVEKKGLTGLSESMSKTWQGVASNISDAFTQIYYSIASNGVFDKLKEAFVGIANTIIEVEPERLQALGKTIAEGLNIIVIPITIVAEKLAGLISSIISLCETNPGLVKLIMTITAIAGVFLTMVGVALKITSALSGLSLMLLTFGKSFSDIGSIVKVGSMKMLGTLIPLTAAIGLLYLAWKSDFAGMRTLVSNFVSNVQGAFSTARQALSMNVGDMMITVRGLQNTGDFWSNITVGLIKIGTFWRALCDAWNDYTLSEDLFLKCQELGILPLITAILDLKYRFSLFKEGFIQGWNEISNKVKEFIMGLLSSLDGTIFDSLLDGVTRFIQKLSENDPESWREFGRIIGQLSAKFVLAFVALKTFTSIAGKVMAVVSIFSKLAGVVKGIPSLFSGLGGKIGNVLTKMFPNIYKVLEKGLQTVFKSNISGIIPNIRIWFAGVQDAIISAVTGIASALGVPVSAVVGVIVAVFASVITYAVTHWEEFKGKILTIWDTIKTEGTAIWETLKGAFSSIFDTIKNAVSIVVESFKNLMSKFEEVKNRMRAVGMRPGFACLFYGGPGTGKTETVIQLARTTGREIVQVNVANLRNMYVGESEKNTQQVFDDYKKKLEESDVTPILLFNEADGIFGNRYTGINDAVNQMENTIQNIILQNMETFEGILIATTNLTDNFDKAFERRFLFKIFFEKPKADVRKQIWMSVLPELSSDDATILATRYDFTGSMIENVARRQTIDEILYSRPMTLDTMKRLCDEELIKKPLGIKKWSA